MIIIDKSISIDEKAIKRTEGQQNFDVAKKSIFENPMHFMLLEWDRDIYFIILILFEITKYIPYELILGSLDPMIQVLEHKIKDTLPTQDL